MVHIDDVLLFSDSENAMWRAVSQLKVNFEIRIDHKIENFSRFTVVDSDDCKLQSLPMLKRFLKFFKMKKYNG